MYLLKMLAKLHCPSDDEIMQSIDSIETYVHQTSKDLICKKEKTKCNNIIKQCKK